MRGERFVAEVALREIDRKTGRVRPAPVRIFVERLIDDVASELAHPPLRLEERDECAGRQHAKRRMAPANERLHTREGAIAKIKDRLKKDLQVLVFQGIVYIDI